MQQRQALGRPYPAFVLADEIAPNPPSPAASDHPSTPTSPASSSPVISAPSNQPAPAARASNHAPAAAILSSDQTTAGKRRHSFSASDDAEDEPLTSGTRGSLSRHISKRRRRQEGKMRLDNDTSKSSQSPSRNFANGSSQSSGHRSPLAKGANGSTHGRNESNGSYTNGGPVANGGSVPATFFGHDREEVTRILIQSLTDLGYHSAAGALCKESGFQLEGPTVAAFRTSVLNGDWEEAEELLFGSNTYHTGGGVGLDAPYGRPWGKSTSQPSSQRSTGLTLAEGANREVMLFCLKQQKYLELLERRDLSKALAVLRQELTPLHRDVGRLHALSALMMCQSAEDLRNQAQWDGARGDSRMHLLSDLSKSISPSIMIPEHRLAVLLDEVKDSWIANCLYHNTAASPSLYLDHNCERDDFPTKAVLDLKHHTGEVWYLQYSNDGTKLASAGEDQTIIIYETNTYKVLHRLAEHRKSGVAHLAWSPDDTKIITCCSQPENSARIWDVKTGVCIQCISDFTYPCTTAAWDPSGTRIILGSQDDNMGCSVWDLDGNLKHNFADDGKLRVNGLALSFDGQRLVVITESAIVVFDYATYERIAEFQLDGTKLTSVTISQDSRHMLVSISPDQIKLMEIDTGDVIQRFEAHAQKQFMIRSAFGGADENFVVSGSEDSRIYIWRSNGLLIEALDAHSNGCANSVAWHPKDPTTFASAGDDKRIRIWKPASASPMPSSSSNGYAR
ncbi:hypothetical protein J4E86_000458 [Alternaria arbusti]|uniref:uncharacterized protein n=1 Tax=Alternaria arbusti TaxID=232088 RepID=UPI00221E7D75|nr:uncharacterized protein J4E86_000458 [Alternaria arbusti]KAI4961430.1 hypothetical protein J4E86_000458 [Alternaria arbusti]